MSVLLKLHFSSYVIRKTRDFSITANVFVLSVVLPWVMKNVLLNCFLNDCTASIYLNAQCKYKHIRPLFHF